MDSALNNLQRLICHKTKPNQTTLCGIILYYLSFIVTKRALIRKSFLLVYLKLAIEQILISVGEYPKL